MSGRLLVVAGEVSGDQHAAAVLRALHERDPAVEAVGIGGDAMAAAGAKLLVHVREMAIFGVFAALAKYPHFRRVFGSVLREVDRHPPSAALLVDYGGFNLRLAPQLRIRGIPVLYYVSPQVWASRPGRIPQMAASVDRLMVIFPFEPEVYADTDLTVEYVGHPLVDEARAALADPAPDLPWPGTPRVALLPGSRTQEIEHILPRMAAAARRLEAVHPEIGFLAAAPNEDIANLVRTVWERTADRPSRWAVATGQTRDVLRQANAAMVASGTATVDAALMGCPMIVVYVTSAPLYALARRLVKIPHIGMVNLIAGHELCPEFIQNRATPGAMAAALAPLLSNTDARRIQLSGLKDVASRLGDGGTATRVAHRVLDAMRTGKREDPAGVIDDSPL